MSADSPRRSSGIGSRGLAVPAIVPPQVVSDRSILDSAIGFINDVTLAHQPHTDTKDVITWARFESAADISDPRFGEDWELEGNVAPPLLLILGYGLGVQVWAIPANGEAVEVLSWRHGVVTALRVLPTPTASAAAEENGRADEPVDAYSEKRPLIALVDGSSSTGTQTQFSAVNFISLKAGTQVKTIKFKNTVLDVLANRSSVVVTFHERIAVFDGRTLDDRLSITTCYPSPGINPNPVALGPRWLAYAEHKLLHSKRSGGGCDGEGVASYTATVLNAAKTLGKGLRELGEQVAAGLTGTSSASCSKASSFDSASGVDGRQAGVVTVIDIKNSLRDYSPTTGLPMSGSYGAGNDPVVVHFIAHSEALVAIEFDNSGLLLFTADRRGHDFHIFRIQPHPVGSSLAAVHHLYVLHRGDTSAKVQNVAFSLDSRWVAVSTLRGTTHVFPITPYGGPMGVRTHSSLHVVNKLSRFHRSAGLSAEGRSSSPISHSESTTFVQSLQPYNNTTLPPFPRPTVVLPLAQLRQPFVLSSPPGSAALTGGKTGGGSGSSASSQRQRHSSLSDDNGKPLSVCAIFAKSRSWLLDPPSTTREAPHRIQRKAVDSLFVMAGHGALIQYDLDTKLASNVAKEKICDDTPIELEVEAKAQWNLGRRKDGSQEIMPPLSADNWLIKDRSACMLTDSMRQYDDSDDRTESWLSQVEIITHAGPHRRLWMGPQFVFKTYNTPSGSNLSHVDAEAVEIGISKSTISAAAAAVANARPDRSSPLNMPLSAAGRAGTVPVLIESGSYSSIEQSPKLMDRFRHDHLDSDFSVAHGDSRLKEDLADAMRESPSVLSTRKEAGRMPSEAASSSLSSSSSDNVLLHEARAEHDIDKRDFESARCASAVALACALPNIHSYETSSGYESLESSRKPMASIEKIVNPLGTVTTITAGMTAEVKTDILDEVVSQLAAEDCVIHENCDEALFRPVVAIFCDENVGKSVGGEDVREKEALCTPPEVIGNKLIVPVIEKEVDAELIKKERQKIGVKSKPLAKKERESGLSKKSKFEELSSMNKKSKESDSKWGEHRDSDQFREERRVQVNFEMRKEEKEKAATGPATVQLVFGNKEVDGTKKSSSGPESDEKSTRSDQTKEQVRLPPKSVEKKHIKVTDVVTEKLKGGKERNQKEGMVKNISTLKKGEIKREERKSENVFVAEASGAKGKECKMAENAVNDKLNFPSGKQDGKKEDDIKEVLSVKKNVSSRDVCKLDGEKTVIKPFVAPNVFSRSTKLDASTSQASKEDKEKDDGVGFAVVECANVQEGKINREYEQHYEKMSKEERKEGQPIAKVTDKINFDNKIEANIGKTILLTVAEELVEGEQKKEMIGIDEKSFDTQKESSHDIKQKETNSVKNKTTKEEFAIGTIIGDPEKEHSEKKKLDKTIDTTNKEKSEEIKVEVKTSALATQKVDQKKPEKIDGELKAIEKSDEKAKKEICETEKDVISKKKIDIDVKAKMEVRKVDDGKTKFCPEDSKEETKKGKIIEEDVRKNKLDTIKVEKQTVDTENEEVKIKKPKDEGKDGINVSSSKDSKEEKAITSKSQKQQKTENYETTEEVGIIETTIPPSPKKRIKETPNTYVEPIITPSTIGEELNKSRNITMETKKAAAAAEFPKSGSKKSITSETMPALSKLENEDKQRKHPRTKEQDLKVEAEREVMNKKDNIDQKACSRDSPDGAYNVSRKPETDVQLRKPEISASPTKQMAPKATSTAWKDLSGADLINRNLLKSHMEEGSKICTKSEAGPSEKLLPELSSPKDDMISKTKAGTIPPDFEEFSLLKPLEALPPLPALEPLSLISEHSAQELKDVSLINFESPLQENPSLERKITPPPRGFTEQNLIFALCGSLHYENDHGRSTSEKVNISSTCSSSVADYKSLTENDEQYMSFEHSSQDTNTTATTNERPSSSPNSSTSEELVIMEEKRLTRKQRRKRQLDLQKKKQQDEAATAADDEELCPLIATCESEVHQLPETSEKRSPGLVVPTNFPLKSATALNSPGPYTYSTTTDSEGPMPATTSDDCNVFTLPVSASSSTPNKLKTKKLEHKINLIAAIEAATSSSTSSAEESGGEAVGRVAAPELGDTLISVGATPVLPLVQLGNSAVAVSAALSQGGGGGAKKKTKRRKR